MNFARCPEEQNVEVFLCEGLFYFRTLHSVSPGEELLIWPTERLSRELRIPNDVTPKTNQRKMQFLLFLLNIDFEQVSGDSSNAFYL